jgi:hypothetical protein
MKVLLRIDRILNRIRRQCFQKDLGDSKTFPDVHVDLEKISRSIESWWQNSHVIAITHDTDSAIDKPIA